MYLIKTELKEIDSRQTDPIKTDPNKIDPIQIDPTKMIQSKLIQIKLFQSKLISKQLVRSHNYKILGSFEIPKYKVCAAEIAGGHLAEVVTHNRKLLRSHNYRTKRCVRKKFLLPPIHYR
jgi:hypothetical protein